MNVFVSTFFVCVLSVPGWADQVVLKNGDRVSGKIVKKDGGALVIKSDLMGDITTKWENVVSVATDQNVTVVPPEGEAVNGKVATSDGRVEVAGKQIPLAKVQAIRDAAEQQKYEHFLNPPITDLWAGFFDIGFSTAQGNAKTGTLNTAFNSTRATRNDSINLHFNQIFARGLINGRVTDTARAIRGGWSYNRNLSRLIFVNLFNDFENDPFQNLDLRLVAGAGLGWNIWKKERGQLNVVGGGSFDHDAYSTLITLGPPPQFTRQSGEVYWGNNWSYKLGTRNALTQSFRLFHNVTNPGEYRVNFDLGTQTRLAKWLSWQVTASDRYITDPSPGRKTNDLLVSSGIRVTFAF